jgi:magnesium transporter
MTAEPEITTAVEEAPDIRALLSGSDPDAAREALAQLHPADQADLYAELDEEGRHAMLSLLSAEQIAHLIEHLDEGLLKEVVEQMPRATLARVLDQTDNDIAADALRLLPPAEMARTLSNMRTAPEIIPLLGHEDESAGGIMTRGYVALHKDMTVEEALSFLRASRPLAEEAYYLYVLDGLNRLQGVVNLRQLVVSPPDTRIEEVMTTEIVSATPDMDQEEVAQLLQHYRLHAIPVIDADGKLQGIVTYDDVIDVIQEEATEDMFQMAGIQGDESIFAPVAVSARRRIPWLLVNLLTAFAAAGVVAAFEGTIERAATLAVFMPIIAGQGGNAGIQTITVVVRSLALGEVEPKDARQVLVKEAVLGVIRGVIFGAIVGGLALALKGDWSWGIVVGMAMLLNMIVAGLMGAIIPLALRAFRADPAIASGVFLTTATDMLGFFFLLGLASVMIDHLH